MKRFIRKYIPEPIVLAYHKILAIFANVIYRFPSRHLIIIGVTGTNGKTTVCNLLWEILHEAGYKLGLASTVNFKIGARQWSNRTKQGMQGRFRLQKFLREMVKQGCTHAIIETTSEGVKQYRHWGIDYDVAVFTNLTPEHIEAHGSFEKYKQAKGRLFAAGEGKGISVVNGDDENAEYFLGFEAREKWVYQIQNAKFKMQNYNSKLKNLTVSDYQLSNKGATFVANLDGKNYTFTTRLLGLFNVYNCAAAIAAGAALGVSPEVIQRALLKAPPVPGRMEVIYDKNRDLTVIVDYAHDPAALEAVYETILESRIIAVLGAVGGGRDKAKRPKLGALAARYAKYVIITNEDPYDDDPVEIMNQVEAGVIADPSRVINQNYWKILDRCEAIKKAVELAERGDIIALTGKGAEEVMAVKGGFVEWDDRKVVREILGMI